MAQWIQGAAPPVSVVKPSACELDGKLYVIGGATVTTPVSTMQIYDIASGTWSLGADMPVAIQNHAMVAVGRRIYTFGGRTSSSYITEVYWYDVDSKQWGRSGTLVGWRLSRVAAEAVGEIVYVFGGEIAGSGGSIDWSRMVLSFNPATGSTSTAGSSLPVPRYGMGSAVMDGKVYLMGGYAVENEAEYKSGRLDVYDPQTGAFQSQASMPVSGECYGTTYGDEIYAVESTNLLIYNPANNAWRYGDSIPSSYGSRASLDAVGNLIYSLPYFASQPIIMLDLRTAEIANMSPANTFVNENIANEFSWQIIGNSVTTQASATFAWQGVGVSGSGTIPVTGSSRKVTVPAGTFPNGTIQWRVSATTTEGVSTGWSAWATFTTVDEPHTKPTNLHPAGGTRNASADIQFSWVVNAQYPTSNQTAFEVQVAYDSNYTWQSLSGKVSSTEPAYTVPANTLTPQAGNQVFWRVVTYNTDNVIGEWSDPVSFLAIQAPTAPQWVRIEQERARPLAVWNAENQTGFQLTVQRGDELIYDSGWVANVVREHRISVYLDNGTYTFGVRYQNTYQLQSEWAYTTAAVEFRQRISIQLDGEALEKANRLEFTVMGR